MVEEDVNPGPDKIVLVSDGYVLQNVTGIRTNIVKKLDGIGYGISKSADPFCYCSPHKLTAPHSRTILR